MNVRDMLVQQFGAVYAVIALNVQGFSHADSLAPAAGGGNTANWILGHLVNVQNGAMRLIGGPPVWESEQLEAARFDHPIRSADEAIDWDELVARFDGVAEIRPAPLLTFAVSPMAQYSDGPLLSYEQASLGNYTIGRGLDPGIALGDRAIGAAYELRYGSLFPREADALALEPFVFVDLAQAWGHDDAGGLDPRRVFTAGGGVRARWGDRADFGLTVAVPLERAGFQASRGDLRVLGTVTVRLVPWGDE